MDKPIDMRSDTVTKPTDGMRDAMRRAAVGDDVMRTDPTVIELEERAAALFGKEAALFVPSGTMANLLAIMSQTSPGDELLTDSQSHIYYYEAGGYAAVAGCSIRFVDDHASAKIGVFDESALSRAIRPRDIHFPAPSLLTIENTHNRGGGVIWPMDTLVRTCQLAKSAGLKVHTDGARIWNASVASGVDLHTLVKDSDTVSACLSKGLGCPVGSLLMGDTQIIEIARGKRKMLGGGMRQAGMLAAAGLYALDHHLNRLAEDHQEAKAFARTLSELSIFDFDPAKIETNLVYAKLSAEAIEQGGDAFQWESKMGSVGVQCYAESASTLRFVMHLDLSESEIEEAATRIASQCG